MSKVAPATSSATGSPAPGASMWRPLRQAVFRSLWIALIASNVGTWMQSVGAAWLMTSLTPSPLLVALLQTATSLPILLLGLPAGALADVVDRRRLLLVTESWLLLVALALGVLTLTGTMSSWTLLGLIFLMGVGGALDGPAWQAVVSDVVEPHDLPAAVSLNIMGFNVARAVGPALGGLVVAAAGPGAVFLLNAVSFLAVLGAIYRWRRTRAISHAPPEDMLGATLTGIRYVRNAPALQAVLVRVSVFIFGASALWALLPIVARQDLGLDATGYGIVLGSLGLGAVAGALLLPRLRRALSIDRLTAGATLVFAGATLALAYLRFVPLVLVILLGGGVAWMVMTSSVNVAAQTAAPAWMRARAVSLYILAFQGVMAVGGFTWGVLAQQFGDSTALAGAALILVGGLVATVRWPLHVVQRLDLTPSGHWADPRLVLTPEPEDGPVLVTIEYRVPAERASAFSAVMEAMRRFRRREGAVRWGLFRDLDDPDRYLETFVVPSWGEHLRQHARVTADDQTLEARRDALLQPGVAPATTHLIAAQVFEGRPAVEPAGVELPINM